MQKVAVLPGMPFYTDGGGKDTIRLNFSNPDDEMIKVGMVRLADVIKGLVRDF
jgi:2-aminoadipate transaminase